MSADSLTDEQRARRLRQRLWGATIVIAILVIVLPLLLDGSGSESQFRRVESLRQEPTRVINVDGSRETVVIPSQATSEQISRDSDAASQLSANSPPQNLSDGWFQKLRRRFTENPPDSPAKSPPGNADTRRSAVEEVAAAPPPPVPVAAEPAATTGARVDSSNHQAWVVQAGSFREEDNALAVRDRLRRAGYPSFVNLSDDGAVFRVRVGPMVNKGEAGRVQNNVIDLLGRDAIVMPYP